MRKQPEAANVSLVFVQGLFFERYNLPLKASVSKTYMLLIHIT